MLTPIAFNSKASKASLVKDLGNFLITTFSLSFSDLLEVVCFEISTTCCSG